MSDDNGGSKLAFFLAGMGVGAVVALLYAPRSGKETREYLSQKAEQGRDYITAKSQEFREQAGDLVEKGKDLVSDGRERVAAAYEAGRQAWKDEKGKARGSGS
jgi:gas vesicle protein